MKLIIFNSQKCKLNLKGKQSQLVAPYWTAYLSEVQAAQKSDEGWAIVNRAFYLLQSMLYDRIVTGKNVSCGSHI